MNHYKLLTPGPLTTTDTVKAEMMTDRCTWDSDYKQVTQRIRRALLKLGHVSEPQYSAVLMQGSGTFGVESVLTSVVGDRDKLLIAANGAYGLRMAEIARHAGLSFTLYEEDSRRRPDPARIAEMLAADPAVTHVAMVHSETTSGILNDIRSVGRVVRNAGKTFIVDAMSSFGGVDIPVGDWGIDFLVSSANKCIQGVPGFSFILASGRKLAESAGKARSLSLDLYDQWKAMEEDGKWRFTSPTHAVLAFARALEELETAAGLREMGVSIGSTTGYTDSMMEVVARRSAALGYAPDAWFSPDAVGGMGRPYPYMIFANMQRFRVSSVDAVVKVGDTVSDVKEGKMRVCVPSA